MQINSYLDPDRLLNSIHRPSFYCLLFVLESGRGGQLGGPYISSISSGGIPRCSQAGWETGSPHCPGSSLAYHPSWSCPENLSRETRRLGGIFLNHLKWLLSKWSSSGSSLPVWVSPGERNFLPWFDYNNYESVYIISLLACVHSTCHIIWRLT